MVPMFVPTGVLALALATTILAQVDYAIVGAGPSGFVLAEYLTRNSNVTVALLEAGTDQDTNPIVTTPAEFFYTVDYQWPYTSQPDPNINGLTPDIAQGKLLGGGSGVNAMLYCRGAASVFDEWAELSGNNGLAWASILDSFRATSHFLDQPGIVYQQTINTSVFGTSGGVEVTRQRELFPLDYPFAHALTATLGLQETDFVSGHGVGVSQGLESIRMANRTRDYAYNAFGYLANERPNFSLYTNAWVSSIGFTNTTANSVTYHNTLTNTTNTIKANEIIITAGAINTPQLLMLSGVGPADLLTQLGIKVVVDSPEVGQNLMDHHLALQEYAVIPEQPTVWQWLYNTSFSDAQQTLYAHNGSGVFGTNNGDVFGALRAPNSVFTGLGDFFPSLPADRPHLIYDYTNVGVVAGTPNISAISAWVAVMQPESRGNVTLASADYRDAPLIYANYWATEAEQAAIMYGYKQMRSILNSDALKDYLLWETYPGVNVTSDADIWAAIQNTSSSWHHPVGTTALGTVLDSNWRVKGVNGLRVVGASAVPQIPTCPIQASIYALANRAALDIAAADGL